jgi:transposase InsO family protein
MKMVHPSQSMDRLCGMFGYSRQSYYKRQARLEKQAFEATVIINLVKDVRKVIPRIGGRKLHFMLQTELEAHQIKIGRDALFELLGAHGLLMSRRKRRTRTTFSNHGLRTYPNLIRDFTPTSPNALWVSDITYIRVDDHWNYVIFVTDAYSRKVLGYNVADHMTAEFCAQALDQALDQWHRRDGPLIHHSDRGLQYCSSLYTQKLLSNNIRISMTENGDPLENAVAERVNGIFKDDFEMNQTFPNLSTAKERIAQMVYHYNHTRPHASCDYLTPCDAHHRQGPLPKRW